MAFDIDAFLATPRLSGLALSPSGDRLVTSVAALSPDGTSFVTSLWEVDPAGERPARRLTRSAPGEATPTFTAEGDLLFVSRRPDPGVKDPATEVPALWLLPGDGGEAAPLAATPAGIDAVRAARAAGTVVVASQAFPGTANLEEDGTRGQARKDAKVAAVLFESYPFKFWDHELGPREPRLFAATLPADGSDSAGPAGPLELRDLTPQPGRALDEPGYDVTPDGATVVTTWRRYGDVLDRSVDLVAIDVATGERRYLAQEDGAWHHSPACSPDGRRVAVTRGYIGDLDTAVSETLWVIDLDSGEERRLAADLDRWPIDAVWSPDSATVYFVADDEGHRSVFAADVATGAVRRLTAAGAFANLCPSPDGRHVYAVRALLDQPPHVVRLDATADDQEPVVLRTPGYPLRQSSRVERVTATASDGVPVHSWLVLPAEASADHPAPLVVFIHGGPLGSWNEWHWRWCPQLLADRGYAVLLPDPALSTGYGQDFVQRGWGWWGRAPYTDLMAAVDAAVARDDVDETRTAGMGGSFGGYMANWVAGHTDRFACLVTHASLWALDQFHATTDDVAWLELQFGDPAVDDTRWRENSPHLHLDRIRTPMLVIHGENDDRVPIGEALRLYTDLQRHGVPSKFLLFPDENHWVLGPNNSRVWYATVLAWLDHYLLGKEFARPELV